MGDMNESKSLLNERDPEDMKVGLRRFGRIQIKKIKASKNG